MFFSIVRMGVNNSISPEENYEPKIEKKFAKFTKRLHWLLKVSNRAFFQALGKLVIQV